MPLTSLSLAGQEHGRTIPLTDIRPNELKSGPGEPLSLLQFDCVRK
jgi:hypothetical protein